MSMHHTFFSVIAFRKIRVVEGEVDNCLSNLKLNYRKQIVNLSQTYIILIVN